MSIASDLLNSSMNSEEPIEYQPNLLDASYMGILNTCF